MRSLTEAMKAGHNISPQRNAFNITHWWYLTVLMWNCPLDKVWQCNTLFSYEITLCVFVMLMASTGGLTLLTYSHTEYQHCFYFPGSLKLSHLMMTGLMSCENMQPSVFLVNLLGISHCWNDSHSKKEVKNQDSHTCKHTCGQAVDRYWGVVCQQEYF